MSQNVLHVKIEVDESVVRFLHGSAVLWSANLHDDLKATLERTTGRLSPASEPELTALLRDLLGSSELEKLFRELNGVAGAHAGDARSLGFQAALAAAAPPERRKLVDLLVGLPWELALEEVHRPLVSTFVHLDVSQPRGSTSANTSSASGGPLSLRPRHVDEHLRLMTVFADPAEGEEDDASPCLARKRILETCFAGDDDVLVDWLQYGVKCELLAQRLAREHYGILYLSGTRRALDALRLLDLIKASPQARPHLVVLGVHRHKGEAPTPLPEQADLAKRLVAEAQVGAVLAMRHAVSGAYSRHLVRSLIAVLRRRDGTTLAAALQAARTAVRTAETIAGEHDPRDDGAPIVFGAEAVPIPHRVTPVRAPNPDHRAAVERHANAIHHARSLRRNRIEWNASPEADETLAKIVCGASLLDARAGFVGRRDQLRRLSVEWLMDRSRPAVAVVTGPPGSGKSWLAAEVIECWYPEFGGIIVSSAADAPGAGTLESLLASLSKQLDAPAPSGVALSPGHDGGTLGQLVDLLAFRNVLLVIDHADQRCCELIGALCQRKDCQTRVLVTAVADLSVAGVPTQIHMSELAPAAVEHYIAQFPELMSTWDHAISGELRALPTERTFVLGPLKRVAKMKHSEKIGAVLRGVREGWISWPLPSTPQTRAPSVPELTPPIFEPPQVPELAPPDVGPPAPRPEPLRPRPQKKLRRRGARSIVSRGAASAFFVLSCCSGWGFSGLESALVEPPPGNLTVLQDGGAEGGDFLPNVGVPLDASSEADASVDASVDAGLKRVLGPRNPCPAGRCGKQGECEPDCKSVHCAGTKLYCNAIDAETQDSEMSSETMVTRCEKHVRELGELNKIITGCSRDPKNRSRGEACVCY